SLLLLTTTTVTVKYMSFSLGSSEELVTPFREVMMAVDGENVTLSCNYSGSANYLYWYQQKSGSSPQHLIGGYSEKTEKLSTRHDKQSKEFHLEISSAALTDSAVYYCALQPTVTGNTTTLYKNLWRKDNTTSTRGSHTLITL
uniref:Ig-like domain-containing protein n=1 Tax=Labrus bergylta TaxID=56723 RepID=A0A3Q3E5H2_9LABR